MTDGARVNIAVGGLPAIDGCFARSTERLFVNQQPFCSVHATTRFADFFGVGDDDFVVSFADLQQVGGQLPEFIEFLAGDRVGFLIRMETGEVQDF